MTRSTSARGDAQGSPTWLLWLVGTTFIILFLWLWNTANSAKDLAEANAELLDRPQAELHFLVGGPNRFAEEFEEAAEDAELGAPAADDLLWTTVQVSNEGRSDLEEANLVLDLVEGLEPTVIAELPSFGSDLGIGTSESGLEVDLRDIDDDETAFVFLGFRATDLPQAVVDNWSRSYQTTLVSATLQVDGFGETLHGRGI